MGAPSFKIRDLIVKHSIRVFSSNYTLYGDMSRRVNAVISDFSPDVEVYSIDETFLGLAGFRGRDLVPMCQRALNPPLMWAANFPRFVA
jgi:DNA polymerase V